MSAFAHRTILRMAANISASTWLRKALLCMTLTSTLALPSFTVAKENFGSTARAGLQVLSDRSPSHLEPILQAFTRQSGIPVTHEFVNLQAIIPTLEARKQHFDVVISKSARILALADEQGLLQNYTQTLQAHILLPAFPLSQQTFLPLTFRVRGIYASRMRVPKGAVTKYEDLVSFQWKGRVCLSRINHAYNLSLFSQMASDHAAPFTQNFIQKLKSNLARPAKGKDRDQIQAIHKGVCDLSLGNSHYLALMNKTSEQQTWAKATYFILPNQAEKGSYIMGSAVGILSTASNPNLANQLLTYLAGTKAQSHMSLLTGEFPFNRAATPHPALKAIDDGDGALDPKAFNVNRIPVKKSMKNRPMIIKTLGSNQKNL